MIVSDLLVSDYSSIYFDYSIQTKPMFTFCYDYDDYVANRGMYFDIREELKDDNKTEDMLLENIKRMDVAKREELSKLFRDKYIASYGHATAQSLDIIYREVCK